MAFLNLNSTFWTARERSLGKYRKAVIIRHTHRISLKERQKRIDFVRAKVVSRFFDILFPDPSVHIDLPFNHSTIEKMCENVNVYYNRGHLRVSILSAAAATFMDKPILEDYLRMYMSYYEFKRAMSRLLKNMRVLRQHFGPNVFDTGELKPTRKFYREMFSRIKFNVPYRSLKPSKRLKVDALWSEVLFKGFKNNHPIFKVITHEFERIRSFIAMIDNGGGSLTLSFRGGKDIDKLTALVPNFDVSSLGGRTLTNRQMTRFLFRKIDTVRAHLWRLLYSQHAIRSTFQLTAKIKIKAHVALNSLAVYSPYVSEVIKPNGVKSYKYHTPSVIKHLPYLEHRKIDFVDYDQMPMYYMLLANAKRDKDLAKIRAFKLFARRVTKR